MDSTTDPSGDLSASESEETLSPKSEEQQGGMFSFTEIYTYQRWKISQQFFSKLINKHSEKRAKFFMVKKYTVLLHWRR